MMMKWISVKDKVSERISERLDELNIHGSVTLMDGIFSANFHQQTGIESGEPFIVFGGPYVPSAMIIENETGKIHFFAIKSLIKKGEYDEDQ